jgi:hypothetical protein
MLSVTNADYLHEYEIKISRSDFLNDFKKGIKHLALEANLRKKDEVILEGIERRAKGVRRPKRVIIDGQPTNVCSIKHLECPNYFWFVTPEGLLNPEDIPEHAGWMESLGTSIRIKKKAPILNKNKINTEGKLKILNSLACRYWKLKLGY